MASGRFDVIVLGVGSMGAAALHRLAARGARVLGIEQFDIGHERGSAGGDTRLIRKAYFEHPDYVPLLLRAYAGWEELEARTDQKVLHRTGALYFGETVIGGSRLAADAHALPYDMLDGPDLARRFPQFEAVDTVAMFEPDAGFVLSTASVELFAQEAVREGATILTGTKVTGWKSEGGGVRVDTGAGSFDAGHLVVTAGPWAPDLLGSLGVVLTVTRQALLWLAPRERAGLAEGELPCWAVDAGDLDGILYGFPLSARGLKVALHSPGPPTTPDDRRPPTDAEVAPVRDAVARILPSAAGPVAHATTCRYTMSPDQHFIVGAHPRHDLVTVACGFSGHGFKFAPVIGDALADLALEGATTLPIGFLAPTRF